MNKILFLIALVLSILQASAQTYVSGGIYSNTSWTKAASPYIVTDTVVVFPGVTLTIEPGATVKFEDTGFIEFRQAKMTAVGTVIDSITFKNNTSNVKGTMVFNIGKSSDTNKFIYCKFDSLESPIQYYVISYSPIIVKNSSFTNNLYAIYQMGRYVLIDSCYFKDNGISIYFSESALASSPVLVSNCIIKNSWCGICGTGPKSVFTNILIDSVVTGIVKTGECLIENCSITNGKAGISNTINSALEHSSAESEAGIIKNCIIKNNSIVGAKLWNDSLFNCTVDSNGVGIFIQNHRFKNKVMFNSISNNGIGILLRGYNYLDNITCNKICENLEYDFFYDVLFNINGSFPNNYFCTLDSASTRPKIFDGYVDIKYGLVDFMPIDTSCYKTLGLKELKNNQQTTTKLYPNPFSQTATLAFENPQNIIHQLTVFNTMGQLVLSIENIKGNQVLIDRKELQTGLYFYQLRNEESMVGSGKMMIE